MIYCATGDTSHLPSIDICINRSQYLTGQGIYQIWRPPPTRIVPKPLGPAKLVDIGVMLQIVDVLLRSQ